MNERYRAALVLKDLHGLESRELAEVLEVSRPAADVLVHRARASFRRVFAGLAGEDAVVPANLALALPLLPVPAALAALPLPLHAPAAGRRDRRRPGAGLLTKIGAALSTKAAVVAAGAAVVAGGGVAAVELAGDDHSLPPASAGGAPAVVHDGAGAGSSHDAWDDRWPEHRRAIAAASRPTTRPRADTTPPATRAGRGPTRRRPGPHLDHDARLHARPTATPSGTTSTGTGTHDDGGDGHDGSEH